MSNSFRDVCHRAAVEATTKSLPSLNGQKNLVKKSLPQESNFENSPRRILRLVVAETGSTVLASRLGVSVATISQWVAGKEIPQARQLEILRETRFFIKSKIRALIDLDDHMDLFHAMQFGEVPRG